MSSGQYWFPSMSVGEIVDAFSGWGISVSHEQVLRPSSDFVLGIYCACLQQVTSITQDSLQEPVQAALATLDSPDMYAQALAHNFLLQRFARAAKIMDFSAKDLSFPDAERTRSVFSAFINLVKFSEQCEVFITGLREKSAAVAQERKRVTSEYMEAEEKVREVQEKLAQDEPKCAVLRTENEEITAYLISCKEKQIAILEAIKNLKQEKANYLKRKESATAEAEQINEQISRTRSRIVQSPERIKRNIITMGSAAAEDKKTVVMHETKIRDLQTRITALLDIEKNVRSCVEQLQIIEKEMISLDASKKSLADFRDQLSEKKGELNELMLKRERVNKQLSNAQEKLERAQRHAEDKRLASQQNIERLQREYEEMAIERRDNDRQVEDMRAQADEIERKMAEHLKKSEAELVQLLTEYWKLRDETDVYMETLASGLGMQVRST
ncbi:kinetochore-associated Ndc80 complex subunit nuf2 [Steccherinum ochraceum]|uniref:Kinetochore-associated Ndc80 complex subunit nuf2 n=1 Tax=Steccherinum ochraceum TaxID=92696 RepID=A0A4R0RGU4_9APHY|nr:kinetochore-associated Ndc80 complex subunit nuf2 [Steccherinum ochraceum]